MRADNGGECWHVLIGAGIGAAVEVASQLMAGEKIDIVAVGIAAVGGAATAALGPAAGPLVSGLTSGVISAEKSWRKNGAEKSLKAIKEIDWNSAGKDALAGAALARVGSKFTMASMTKMSKKSGLSSKTNGKVKSLIPSKSDKKAYKRWKRKRSILTSCRVGKYGIFYSGGKMVYKSYRYSKNNKKRRR